MLKEVTSDEESQDEEENQVPRRLAEAIDKGHKGPQLPPVGPSNIRPKRQRNRK